MMSVLNSRRVAVNVLLFLIIGVSFLGGYSVSQRQGADERRFMADRITQARASEQAVCQAKTIDYEKRLGTQSAQYALDATNFGEAVKSFSDALKKMDIKNDRRAAERERAQAMAIVAAERAAAAASVTAKKTDQILVKQEAVQQQVAEAATAAQAAEKKLDTATMPALPAHPHISERH